MSSYDWLRNISDLKINIDNQQEFEKYVDIFSLKKIAINYGFPFIDQNTHTFYRYVTSTEICNLIDFDKNLSGKLLRSILMLEWKLKNVIVDQWKKFYNLKDTLIYNYSDDFFLSLIPNIEKCNDLVFDKFKYSLFEYAVTSDFLNQYNSLTNIPFEDLVDSWSLATTINFYRVLDDELQMNVVSRFKLPRDTFSYFHKMLNLILKIRNTLSHNYTAYNMSIKHYRIEFNKIFNLLFPKQAGRDNDNIHVDKIAVMLDYLLSMDFLTIEISNNLRNLNLNPISKERIIKFIYGEN